MCLVCNTLLCCPIGQKRKVKIGDDESNPIIEIVIDRYPNETKLFIHSEYTDNNGNWHNTALDIKHCPFCGKNLLQAAENKIKEIPKVKPKRKYSLKPCKVCGRKGIVYRIPPHKHLFVNMPDFEGRTYIECAECGLLISASTIKGAVFKWNRRGANNDD